MGNVADDMERPIGEGLAYYRRALVVMEAMLPMMAAASPQRTEFLAEMGSHQFLTGIQESRLGRMYEATVLYEQADATCRSAGDPRNMRCSIIGAIAVCLQGQGKPAEALATLERAVPLATTPRQRAEIMANKPKLLNAVGRSAEAFAMAKKATELVAAVSGPRSSWTANTLSVTADIAWQMGERDAAAAAARRSISILTELGEATTIVFGCASEVVGLAELHRGRPDVAMLHFNAAMTIFRTRLGMEHACMIKLLGHIAQCRLAVGNLTEASDCYAQAEGVRRRLQTSCARCKAPHRPDGSTLEQCGGCKRTHYCGRDCQTADWKARHKGECAALAAERE